MDSRVIELRKILAERFPNPVLLTPAPWESGVPGLDRVGGLRRGAITEITSPPPSAGSALLIHSLLQEACRKRFFIALIDGVDSFDVESVEAETLSHLLWVRCENTAQAFKAADLLLRDGNFPIVILDLILNPVNELRRIAATSWYRLQRLVEPAATAFVVMSRHNLVASAQLKLQLESSWSLADLAQDHAGEKLKLRLRRAHKMALAP